MTTDVVKTAFIAGEISPKLFGRTDLTKYDLAMAEAANFYVDYLGGLNSRPGTRFGDFIMSDDKPTKMFPFSFSADLTNNYVLLFGHNYIRFIQDGAYVLETAKIVSNVVKTSGSVLTVTTSTAHGFTAGDWIRFSGVTGMVELNDRTFQVASGSGTTLTLSILPAVSAPDTTLFSDYVSDGTVARVYTKATTFDSAYISSFKVEQYRDLVRITSDYYAPYDLTRVAATNWTLTATTTSTSYTGPTISSSTSSGTGTAQTVFAVTKVLADGSESVVGNLYKLTGIVNYVATSGSVSISWGAASDAQYYNVYRSIVGDSSTALYEGVELGYVGKAYGATFTDSNIIPDFTKNPANNYNPFDPGAITDITISSGGSGYTAFGTTVSVSGGGGSGFVGQVITNSAGAIVNVIIKNPGSGYTSPTVSFTGAGTGAAATATARSSSGTYPSVSVIFQQRQIYAASLNNPVTLWGSQIKRFDNFNSSIPVVDSDSFEFDLDSSGVAPIKHMFAARGGLIAMTQENVWLLSGGSTGDPLTPTNALAQPQTYTGVSDVKPLIVGEDILYEAGKGYSIRLLSYNELTRVYGGADKSILASHLFGPGKSVLAWAYQESPYKIVWAAREDGALLAFTIDTAEQVFGWTPCYTQNGNFTDVTVLRENQRDVIYVCADRYVNGRWSRYFEMMDSREYTNVEDYWGLDSALDLNSVYPAFDLSLFYDSATGVWAGSTSYPGPFDGSTGYYLRAGNGLFKVTRVSLSSDVSLEMIVEPTNYHLDYVTADTSFTVVQGDWTLTPPTTSITGLWHLEGQTVNILADGNVQVAKTVYNGSITLDNQASKVIVGLGITCIARTLPAIIPGAGIEARRRRVVGVGIREYNSIGLKVGPELDLLQELRYRTTESYGVTTVPDTGLKYQLIPSDWDENGQVYIVQDQPLPANILSVVLDLEVGDEKD